MAARCSYRRANGSGPLASVTEPKGSIPVAMAVWRAPELTVDQNAHQAQPGGPGHQADFEDRCGHRAWFPVSMTPPTPQDPHQRRQLLLVAILACFGVYAFFIITRF